MTLTERLRAAIQPSECLTSVVSNALLSEAANEQETIDGMLAEIKRLRFAVEEVIDFNRVHAQDQYGDANKAETWSCVRTLRAALGPNTGNERRTTTKEIEVSEWQPIDTAPKDGRPVWARGWNFNKEENGYHYQWAWWNADEGHWESQYPNPSAMLFVRQWLAVDRIA